MVDDRAQHTGGQGDDEAARLHEEAQRHYDRGAYADARALFERALALRRAALGDDDLATANTLGALALVLAQQGDAAEAQPMIEHVLAMRERALSRVMDASAASQAYFEDMLARTEDPLLGFVAAGALADRAGEATPERAVEALVAAAGTTAGVPESAGLAGIAEMKASLTSAESVEWVGAVRLAVRRLLKLGATRAAPALLRAFQRTRAAETARTVAEPLLDLTFNEGRVQSKSAATSRGPDGRLRVQYWHAPRQPKRAPSTLSAEQRAVLQALAAHEPFWRHEHDLLALYGLPAARADLQAFLDA